MRASFGTAISRVLVGVALGSQQATVLTEAASRIVDVDVATTVAEHVRLKIIQQAATSVLAQTNGQRELVLRLLRS